MRLLVAYLTLVWTIPLAQVALSSQPNVVVFLTDDQGWGDLSVNGNTNLATPNIDSLARDGRDAGEFLRLPSLRSDASRIPDGALLSAHRRQRCQSWRRPAEL